MIHPPQKRERIYLFLLLLTCILLVAVRLRVAQNHHYAFLYWNLFLAFLPWGFSSVALWLKQKHQSRWRVLLLCGLWLLFFPNAPYIITDLMHLGHHPQMPPWYDPLMVFTAAMTGLLAGFLSLYNMERILVERGPVFRHVFVSLIWFLSAIGLYLGRVVRWNSWDILEQPQAIVKDILKPFWSPSAYPNTLGMILSYTVVLFLIYQFWSSHKNVLDKTESAEQETQ